MSRRIIAIVGAVALALVGTVALANYVNQAERRALSGEDLIEVYVVTTPIPTGTPAEEIESMVAVEQVPVKVRPTAAVQSLPSLAGTVAAVDLEVGEQLIMTRFLPRNEVPDRAAGIEIADDLVEITIELEPQRAIGGLLEPGQRVLVTASFEPFELTRTLVPIDGELVPVPGAVAEEAQSAVPNETDVLLRKVLVTAVQEPQGRSEEQADDRLTTAPGSSIFVTLAVTPIDATRVVFASEFGSLWLAIERDSVPEGNIPGQTRGSVLLDRVRAE